MTYRYYYNTGVWKLREVARSALGDDGKTEVVNGQVRNRWNKYHLVSTVANKTKGYDRYHNSSIFTIGSVGPFSTDANDIVKLQSQLVRKVRMHDFNLAVNVAEGKQTVSMVVDAIRRVGQTLLELKRGRFESAARHLGVRPRPSRKLDHKDLAGRWLEMKYGWEPMLSDVYSAATAFERLSNPPRRTRVATGIDRNPLINASSSSSYTMYDTSAEKTRLLYEMTEELSMPRSLGLFNPLSVAWEVIPYSFVFDWFIPIGTYLDNLNVIPQLRGRFLLTQKRSFSGSSLATDVSQWIIPPTIQLEYFELKRTPMSELQVMKPRFVSIPEAMSPGHIWNALALTSQKIRSKSI